MKTGIFLGLGSNVGNRRGFLRLAIDHISGLQGTTVMASSSIYETEPYGVRDQPDFLNAVLEVRTNLSPDHLHKELKKIESDLGRIHSGKWEPREIDIDLLYFGTEVISTTRLRVPHRGVAERRFVLEPLVEIAPDTIDPELGLTFSEMLSRCPDHSRVKRTADHLINSVKEN